MRKFALALAAATSVALAVPAFAQDTVATQGRIQLAQADVKVKINTGAPVVRKRVIVHRTTPNRIVVRTHPTTSRTVIRTRPTTTRTVIRTHPTTTRKVVIRRTPTTTKKVVIKSN